MVLKTLQKHPENSIWKWLNDQRKLIFILILISTVVALLNIGVIVTENIFESEPIKWGFYIINEFTGSFALIPFVPILFFLFWKFPLNKKTFIRRIWVYLILSICYGFLHTSLMYSIRVPLYKWINIGDTTDIFNNLFFRYLMEYCKQFIVFWVVYGVHVAVKQFTQLKKTELRSERLKNELTNTQLSSLQSMLHPHFFFNTLNTISSIMYSDPEKADRIISKLSLFLRKTMALDVVIHTLGEELSFLDDYIVIMEERFGPDLNVHRKIDPQLMGVKVPALILQPLVENAIKFSVADNSQSLVEIEIQKEDSQLNILIIDNGPGLSGQLKKGVGISSTVDRLEALYGRNYYFKIMNNENVRSSNGTVVILKIPMIDEAV